MYRTLRHIIVGIVLFLVCQSITTAQSMAELEKWTTESRRKDIVGHNVYYFKGTRAQFRKVESGVNHWVEEGVYLEGSHVFYKRGGSPLSQELQNALISAGIRIDYNGRVIGARKLIQRKTSTLEDELDTKIDYDYVDVREARLLGNADYSIYNISKRISVIHSSVDSSIRIAGGSIGEVEFTSVGTGYPIILDDVDVRNRMFVSRTDSARAIVLENGEVGTLSTDTVGLTIVDMNDLDSIAIRGVVLHAPFRMERVSVGKLIMDEKTSVLGRVNMSNVQVKGYGRLHERSFPNGLDLEGMIIERHIDVFVNTAERKRTAYRYRWSDLRDGKLKLRKYQNDTELEYTEALTEIYRGISDRYRRASDDKTADEVLERLDRILRDRAGGLQKYVNVLFPEKEFPIAIWILLGLWALSVVVFLSRESLRSVLIELHEWGMLRKQSRWLLFLASCHYSAALVFGIKYQRSWLRENQVGFVIYGIVIWLLSKSIYGIAVVYAIRNVPVFDFVRSWFIS